MIEINRILSQRQEPPYRLTQIRDAIFKQFVSRYSLITALPLDLRKALADALGDETLTVTPAETMESPQAVKVLFELPDAERSEAVLLHDKKGDTSLCVSTQVGCNCACDFCATGAIGFQRHLTADEIVDQALYFLSQEHRLGGISFMGMGEPLLNPHFFDALHLFVDKEYLHLGSRHLNVSTIGVIPGLERLSAEFPQVNIAFSLHSPFPKERDSLVPLNRTYPFEAVMLALDRHLQKSHRKVFIVYAVFDGLNDSPEHARALVGLLKNRGAKAHLYHVNLMRYNRHADACPYHTSEEKLQRFYNLLWSAGLNVTIRHSPGAEIEAACGQLYAKYTPHRAP